MKSPGLYIQATGMCCAVGHSTASASAALGACVDHFRHSWFQTLEGSPLPCAQVWGLETWGPERMGQMFSSVIQECREQVDFDPRRTALLLLVPDPERPGTDADWPLDIYEECTKKLSFHDVSRICPWDRAGLGPTLQYSRELIGKEIVDRVVLAGVDSYLNAITINAFLDDERLLTPEVSDGCILGEGAGAVVLGLGPESENKKSVYIRGVGCGYEFAHLLQTERANRADGLVQAIREAVVESGRPLTDICFHICDSNGLGYYAVERALAMQRTLEHRVKTFPVILPASYTGDVGAASGPLMLAYLTRYMPREAFGYGLIHCSSDNGHRCAVLVEYI